ncbi:hypothetical protein TeGR_g14243, partial [Tetraparma gracilis]
LEQVFEPGGCFCAHLGVVEGVDTGRPGCGYHGGDSELGARFCYTHPTCALATPSPNFPGAAWRACEMEEDEDIERVFKCVAAVPVAKVVVPALATPRNDTVVVGGALEEGVGESGVPRRLRGGGEEEYLPVDCLEVKFVDSCVGTIAESMLAGVFVFWEGECANTGGRPVYYNSLTEMFLFYYSPYSSWAVAAGCGMTSGIWAYGGAGWYPFEDTAATWACSENGPLVPGYSVTIECSIYDGQPLPCSPGKYEPAGEAPGGDCTSSCPPHLPTSPPGSTSLSSCMSLGSNFLLVSDATDHLMELNFDESDFSLAIEGGDLRSPWGVACVSEILCLVGNRVASNVVAVNLRGEVMGVFAQVGSPAGLLHIKHLHLLAVAGGSVSSVLLFDLADLNLEQPLQESDAVQTIVMSASDGKPMYISLGEHDSELLITTTLGKVLRRCLDDTGCNPQTRNSVMMLGGGSNLEGIGVLDETYIVADRTYNNEKIYECPLTSGGIYKTNCEVFAYQPQGTEWDPFNVLVDPIKRLVFVVDRSYSDVLVLDFDGSFLAPLASSRGALVQPFAMAQRPGLYAPLSPSHSPSSLPAAGERIEVALAMMDAYNSTVSNSHPTSAHDLALEVSATGYITGTNFTTTIAGEIMYDKNSPAHASLTASVVIPYAGDWSVEVTQGTYNVQNFLGSPHMITVAPAATDPDSCVVEIPGGRSITAGSSFEAIVETFDEFENPTSHPEDSFKSRVELGNSEENFGNRHVLSSDHTFSELQTKVGSYKLYLYHTNTQREVVGSPISFDVLAAGPSAATSTVSAGNTTSIVSASETALSLQAFVNDAFGNEVLDAPGVVVKVQGLDPVDPAAIVEHVLEAPRYSHTVTVPEGLEATLSITFGLDDAQIGEPVEITVAPPPPKPLDHTTTYAAVGISSFLLLVGAFFYLRHLKHAAMRLESVQLEMVDQNQAFARQKSALEAEKEELEEEVRLKKHSEEELKVMVSALEAVSKERQDELKEVMMESKELKIDKLLGKGGFGVVNLATYRGTKVAMKQLLTVNEENVLRFRHECFLTKNLSHPNVVKLVGVCWSEELFACCLEFVENGSLEDWLRRTVGGKKYVAAKKPVIGKKQKKQKKKGPPLSEVTFNGFDHNGEYNTAEHTDVDRAKKEEAEKLLHHWWMQRMNPKMKWTEMLKEDKSRLDHGISAYGRYDHEAHCGDAVVHTYINATPHQVMGYFADRSKSAIISVDALDETYTADTSILQIPIPIPTVSDRESLYRSVKFRNDEERSYTTVSYTVEDERKPVVKGKVRIESLASIVVKEAPGTEGEGSEVWRMARTDFKFAKGLGFINKLAATKAGELMVAPLEKLKLDVERLLKEYKPPEHFVEELDLTWKGGLWRMALEAALGVQYLHHHRYWSDGGKRHNGATNEIEEEEAGWKESVIHRDLKPDNMLLTREWTLKLTDFGEARAQNMGGTMTSVGTPIYIAPEVMRADHYDQKADTWSFGLCLVAMIRAERTLEQFFYQALRKHKKRRTTKGLGLGQMTKYYYSEGWRPILPIAFVKAYPKLHTLIQECWRVRRKERPNFDEIVKRLQGDIGDEIKRKEEPKIELYSKEDDLVYRNRMGKEDELSDSDGEEEGGKSTRRGGGVSKEEHSKAMAAKDKAMAAKDKAMAAKDKAMAELKDKSMAELKAKSKAMRELQEKAGAKQKKTEAALEERKEEALALEVALQEKTAEAGRWGAALQELKV